MSKRKQVIIKGFTLIELLIVIGIISILAAITIVTINPGRQFGRASDAERVTDMNAVINGVFQFQTNPASRGALPQCYVGVAPALTSIPTCDTDASGVGVGNGGFEGALQLGTASDATTFNCSLVLSPNYIKEMPVDPDDDTYSASASGYYICQQSGTIYVLSAGAEVDTTTGCEIPGTTTETLCVSG